MRKSVPWGAPDVREGESVDIEIDSGAEVICLLVNTGADTCPLHETRLSSVEVTTLRLVAANCTSSVPRSWGWRLQTCEAML